MYMISISHLILRFDSPSDSESDRSSFPQLDASDPVIENVDLSKMMLFLSSDKKHHRGNFIEVEA